MTGPLSNGYPLGARWHSRARDLAGLSFELRTKSSKATKCENVRGQSYSRKWQHSPKDSCQGASPLSLSVLETC